MESFDNLDMLRYSDGDLSTAEIRNPTMQDVMQEHADVYRTSETLSEGKGEDLWGGAIVWECQGDG